MIQPLRLLAVAGLALALASPTLAAVKVKTVKDLVAPVAKDCDPDSWFYKNCLKNTPPGFFGHEILKPGTPLIRVVGASGADKNAVVRAIAKQNGFGGADELKLHILMNVSEYFLDDLDVSDEDRQAISELSSDKQQMLGEALKAGKTLEDLKQLAGHSAADVVAELAAEGITALDATDLVSASVNTAEILATLGNDITFVDASPEFIAAYDEAVQDYLAEVNAQTAAEDSAAVDAWFAAGNTCNDGTLVVFEGVVSCN